MVRVNDEVAAVHQEYAYLTAITTWPPNAAATSSPSRAVTMLIAP